MFLAVVLYLSCKLLFKYRFFFIDTKVVLPRSCLPTTVPHFTGRQNECDEIIGHAKSESTRIVSIWGSPGFGKTSIAINVGHHLQSEGLPIYFLSLRGSGSKADLTSKLLSFLRQSSSNEPSSQPLSLDDELCELFSRIVDRCVFILDNMLTICSRVARQTLRRRS